MDFEKWWNRILHDLGSVSSETEAKALARRAWDAAKAQSGNYAADDVIDPRAVAKKKTVLEWSDAGAIGSVAEAKWQGEQLSFRVDAFLRSRGWEHTSSTPGSYWLWGRTIDGKALWVDQAHALGIEASQEPDDIDGDEELGG